jgi:hypothetical protein
MARYKALLQVTVLVIAALIPGCGGGLTSESGTAAEQALVSLRKIDSSTELQVSLSEYRIRLVETKAEVENALSKLPDGELKKELSLALDAYVDRQRVLERKDWSRPSPNDAYAFLILLKNDRADIDLAEVLTQKYGVQAEEDNNSYSMNFNAVRGALYQAGRKHIGRASELLKE